MSNERKSNEIYKDFWGIYYTDYSIRYYLSVGYIYIYIFHHVVRLALNI